MCQEHTVTRLRPALGTLVAIEARSPELGVAERALEVGFAAIRGVEERLHPARGSDVARLNHSHPGRRLVVHPSTVTLLRLSRELSLASGGRFEPAVPGHGSVLDWRPAGRDAIVIDRRAHVDLGGIAKGFAVDLAVAAMRRAGATSGLVNAGGDLRVYGRMRWTGWVRSADGAARELTLRDCALGASDPTARHRPDEHRGYYPGRGLTRAAARCCAVLAPRAALADALTKVVLQASPARSAAILARFRARAIDAAHGPACATAALPSARRAP
jgi:FAD:protein FMN transferase